MALLTVHRQYSHYTQLSVNVLPQDPTWNHTYSQSSCFPVSFHLSTVCPSGPWHFQRALTIHRLCRKSLNLGLFSHDYIRVLYFWQGSHRRDVMPFQGPARWHVTSEYLTTGGVNSDHWWRWCLPGPCGVPTLLPLINECFGEVLWNSVNVLFLILSSV